MKLKDYSATGELEQYVIGGTTSYSKDLTDLGFERDYHGSFMGPIITSDCDRELDLGSLQETRVCITPSTVIEVQTLIDEIAEVLTLVAWIDAHILNSYVLNQERFQGGLWSTSYQTLAFSSIHWHARLTEVLMHKDAALLNCLDLAMIKTNTIQNKDQLMMIIPIIKTDSFYFLKPLIYGSKRKFQKWKHKITTFWDTTTISYNAIKAVVLCKIPFIYKIITTPTQEIVDYKLYDYHKNDYAYANSEAEFDDIYTKYRALCESL